jgi:hypothetical protein
MTSRVNWQPKKNSKKLPYSIGLHEKKEKHIEENTLKKEDGKEDAETPEKAESGVLQSAKQKEAEQLAKQTPLKPFDYDKVSLDSMILVLGKRRYGKSVWAEWFLSHIYQYFPRGGYVFTNTKHNWFWQKHFPDNRIYAGLNSEVLTEIFNSQKNIYNAILQGAQLDTVPNIVLIFDDVISNRDIKRNPMILKIAWEGRHYFILALFCSQDVKGLDPGIRQNADLIALTYQTQERSIESIKEDYADFFDNKYYFRKILMNNTRDHQLIIIDQTEAKYGIEDVFFIDKAPDPKKEPLVYRVGNDAFWEKAQNNWKEQLRIAENIPNNKREFYNEKLREMEKNIEEEEEEEVQDDDFLTAKETKISEYQEAVPLSMESLNCQKPSIEQKVKQICYSKK